MRAFGPSKQSVIGTFFQQRGPQAPIWKVKTFQVGMGVRTFKWRIHYIPTIGRGWMGALKKRGTWLSCGSQISLCTQRVLFLSTATPSPHIAFYTLVRRTRLIFFSFLHTALLDGTARRALKASMDTQSPCELIPQSTTLLPLLGLGCNAFTFVVGSLRLLRTTLIISEPLPEERVYDLQDWVPLGSLPSTSPSPQPAALTFTS